jgi:drug/metabolite transporter (DMT)-like permease
MNLGLLFTPVSIFQMTRGAVVLFVGVFSVVFLKHRIRIYQWIGLLAVCSGVFVVGMSAALGAHSDNDGDAIPRTSWEVICGILMILSGQVFTASQFVVEEHILSRYSLSPTKVVAWEGTYGTVVSAVGSYVVLLIAGRNHSWSSMFDIGIGVSQVLDNPSLIISSFAIMISLATFNFCGLSVTRSISATSRSTIDTSRTLGIWFVSLLIGWESFRLLQLVGFAMLVYGTLLFNGILEHGKNLDADDPLPHHVPHEP